LSRLRLAAPDVPIGWPLRVLAMNEPTSTLRVDR
jgi:hypothetical protein